MSTRAIRLNPHINYPFAATTKLSTYIAQAHARNIKVKIYYTIRELSNYAAEFWALRSLGNEVFLDGPGFKLADQFLTNTALDRLPKTGGAWLCEHVVSGYVPAWHTPLGNGHYDAVHRHHRPFALAQLLPRRPGLADSQRGRGRPLPRRRRLRSRNHEAGPQGHATRAPGLPD